MADVVEWVFYHPPKSQSFGHGSRFRDTSKTWSVTKTFLADFTTAGAPAAIELTCRGPGQWLSADAAGKRITEAEAAFGPPSHGDAINGAKWDLGVDCLEDAVAFECDTTKPTSGGLAPSRLHFNFHFRWKAPWNDPDVKGLGDSRLALHISDGSMLIQPGFVFLSSLESVSFREQLLGMESATPFRFSDANFKRWLIPLSGKSAGRYLRPPKDWRKSWNAN
ncbi:MAG: hypothetical protein JNM59_04235 [Hyphomonadaceae bacterium]|nr:hypothetical protein [Hyphomonadaceae bacterium]